MAWCRGAERAGAAFAADARRAARLCAPQSSPRLVRARHKGGQRTQYAHSLCTTLSRHTHATPISQRHFASRVRAQSRPSCVDGVPSNADAHAAAGRTAMPVSRSMITAGASCTSVTSLAPSPAAARRPRLMRWMCPEATYSRSVGAEPAAACSCRGWNPLSCATSARRARERERGPVYRFARRSRA